MLLDRVRDRIRVKHYSIRTEQAYCDWIRRFIIFHGKRHPSGLGAAEVEAFLTSLAVDGRVAASTQNQAKSALLFLYREVLGVELPWLDGIQKAKAPVRLPVVLTRDEVARVLARLDGVHRLIGALLYGTGLRIMEAMRLRVKDVEFSRREILVRDGKGNKDRVTMLPVRLVGPLREQIEHARELHRGDLADGFGAVWLPFALDRKYPGAAREWGWQYVFPAASRSIDPRDGDGAPASSDRPGVPARDEERGARARGSRSRRRRTRCATRSRRTCSNRATTSGRCRSCSGTRT